MLDAPHPFARVASQPSGVAPPAETKVPRSTDKKSKYSAHHYKMRLRPTVWSVLVEGKYKTMNSSNKSVSVGFNRDLGYDDPYPTFSGDAGFRWGKHDFWVTGTRFDQSERAPVNVEFSVDGEIFNVGGVVGSEVSITDINFRYGYSFFEFEKDGFRLGPTFAVSYTDISLAVTELTVAGVSTGDRFAFEYTLPIPTIGFHAEIPHGEFLISTQFGGFYVDIGDTEVTGMRAEAGVTWRPYKNIGYFVGIQAIYADLNLDDREIDDLILWGPAVGLEIRF